MATNRGHWQLFDAKLTFSRLSSEWQFLSHKITQSHPLLHTDFIAPLIEFFGSDQLLLAKYSNSLGHTHAMLLVQRHSFGVWHIFAPPPAPLGIALFDPSSASEQEFMLNSLARSLPGPTFMVCFNKFDPSFPYILIPNRGALYDHMEFVDYIQTLSVELNASFDAYWAARGRNLKRDIKRNFSRIRDFHSSIVFRQLISPDDIIIGVKIYGEIESSGWKGKADSAVHSDNPRGRFYAMMLESFAKRHCATIYQLLIDDQVVASALAIKNDTMIVLLKTTYNEAFSHFSPGWLLMYEIHKSAFSAGDVRRIEYYGRASQKQLQFANTIRLIQHINYYPYIGFKKLRSFAKRVYRLLPTNALTRNHDQR